MIPAEILEETLTALPLAAVICGWHFGDSELDTEIHDEEPDSGDPCTRVLTSGGMWIRRVKMKTGYRKVPHLISSGSIATLC
jgi:hypothetical protein